MPRSIAEIRKANGGLENLTDEDILQSTFQQYKSYYPSLDEYAAEVGYGGAGRSLTGSRISAGVDQYQANLLGLGGAVARGLGAEGVAGAFDQRRIANEDAAAYANQRSKELGGVDDWRNIDGVGSAFNFAGGLAAQSLPYLGEAAAGALTGGLALGGTAARMGLTRAAASQVGAVAAGYPSAVGDVLSAQRDAGGERLGAAALGGIPYAALNAIGIEGQLARGLRPIVDVGGSLTRRVVAGAGMGAVGESIGETGQEIVNQVAGRMAVDPNETIFNEEANRRYIDAAVGGATLGGLFGAGGGIRSPRRPDTESDLTKPLDTTTRPDPSQFVTQDQTVGLKKFIDVNTGVVRPSRKEYEKQFAAAFDEPSGQFVADAATGVERELTVGELMQRGSASMDLTQDKPADAAAAATAATKVATTRDPRDVFLRDTLKVTPNPNSRQLFTLMEAEGIDPTSPVMVPVWNYAAAKYLTPKRLEKATELMDKAIIESRKEAPSGTGISTVQQPAGGVGVGSPVVQGTVGDAGRVAPVSGAVDGGAPAAGAPLQQAGLLPVAPGQPSTPVTTGAPSGTQTSQTIQTAPQGQTGAAVPAAATAVSQPLAPGQFRRAPRPMTVLEAARAVPTPPVAPVVTEPAAPDIIGQIFGEGDADIIRGFLMGKSSTELAAEAKAKGIKGRGEQMIRNKIAGEMAVREEWPKKIAAAKQKFGYTDEQIQQALEASMAPDVDTRSEVEREMNLGRADLYGVRMSESEAIEAGLEGSVKSAGAGSSAVKGFTKLQKDIDAMYKRLETEKDPLVLAYVTNRLTELQAKVEAFEDKEQARIRATAGVGDTDGEVDLVAAAQEAEPKSSSISDADAAKEAEAAKFRAERAAKLQADRNGLAVGDTVKNIKLGTGVVKSFAGDGDATTVTVEFQSGQTKELSVKLAKLEKTDAVQVKGAASVPVQPKAETSKAVGGQVRRAKKPAAEGKAQVPAKVLTEAEQAAQAWDVVAADFPEAPKFADLTKAQQDTFIGFGEGNWERGDVELELTKLARGGPTLRALRTVTTVDEDNATVELQEQELSRLETVPGVGAATDRMRKEGLGDLVDYVGSWYTTDSKVNWDGGFTAIDGQAAVLLRRGALTDSERVEWTVYHEVGHAADQTHLEGGGVFSSLPQFNVRLEKGQIKPMGKVMKAAFDHYNNEPTSDLSKHLSYPFDRAQHGDLDGEGIREELFAQLWATYTTRDGREFLEDNLPEVADFMEQVYEQVKQTDYAAAAANETQRSAQAGSQATQGNGQPRQVPLRQTTVPFRALRQRQGLIDRNIAKLPKMSQQPVNDSINTISDWVRQGLDRLVFTSDLINRAVAAGIKSAANFESLLAKRSTKARSLEREVERVADMYATIEEANKGSGPNSVNQFIFESTRTGKWGYDKGSFKANPEMAAQFKALGPKAQAYVKAVFTHGDTMLAAKKKAVVDYATSEYDARIAAETDSIKKAALVRDKADDLKKFASLFRIREGIPYAPIKRFGDHVVVAKSQAYIDAVAAKDTKLIKQLEQDPDHYHVSFTETKNEARNLAAQLEDQGFFSGGTVAFKERSVADKELFGNSDSLDAITRLRAMADAKANSGDKGAAQMQRMVSDMYLQALAEGSARKSEMRRRGVSGEIDMLRSFAAQGRADANFVASVEYNPQVQDAIQAMRKESNEGSGDLNRKSEILNEITRRYDSSLDAVPTPNIAKLTRLSSIYYLATSPAYYMQNLTQPWMMSVPAMAGRHDYGKTSAALFTAYGQLGGVMKSARYDQQFDFSKVPDDVRAAIQELANRGKIDIGLETELGEFKIDGDGAFSKGWNKVDKFLRLAVQKVESINRLSTAMAAYRLELAKNGDKEAAINYADRILTETHGDYSSFNAPRAFNNPVGKVALQFRKFQLIQLTYYAKLLKDAGFNTEEKRAATKALTYSLGHTALLAGAMGLPGYSAIAWAIGALFGDDDDPLDVTAELRKFIGDETVANLIMRGAPTLAGVDISGKVGAGTMLSIMPFSNADLTTRAGVIEAAGTLLGGAPVGMIARVSDGLGQMLGGEWYKGMEQVLPKGLGDAAKAYRISTEGMTRRNGDIVLPASEVSAWEALVQGMGIQPAQQSVVMERQSNTLSTNQFYQDRTTKIKAQYIRAVRAGESTAEARAAWMKLQEARVKNGYKRQPLSELLRAPQSQAKREKQVIGGVQFNRNNKRFVEEQI